MPFLKQHKLLFMGAFQQKCRFTKNRHFCQKLPINKSLECFKSAWTELLFQLKYYLGFTNCRGEKLNQSSQMDLILYLMQNYTILLDSFDHFQRTKFLSTKHFLEKNCTELMTLNDTNAKLMIGNFSAHMSGESPSNISPNPSEVISEVSEPQDNF